MLCTTDIRFREGEGEKGVNFLAAFGRNTGGIIRDRRDQTALSRLMTGDVVTGARKRGGSQH